MPRLYRSSLFVSILVRGERSRVVKAPVCGTGDHGFEPRRSPQRILGFVLYPTASACSSMDRALGFGPRGCGFESCQARQFPATSGTRPCSPSQLRHESLASSLVMPPIRSFPELRICSARPFFADGRIRTDRTRTIQIPSTAGRIHCGGQGLGGYHGNPDEH